MAWDPVADWKNLPGVHPVRPDPYVIWAQLTAWADYPTAPWTPPPLPWHCRLIRFMFALIGLVDLLPACPSPTPAVRRAVIIELDNVGNLGKFLALAATMANDIEVPPIYGIELAKGTAPPSYGRYLTAFVTAAGLQRLALPAPEIGQYVQRFDLCEVIEPGRPLKTSGSPGSGGPPRKATLEATQLLGILDDGCPYAHRSFWSEPVVGKPSTRFAAFWDQNAVGAAFSPRPSVFPTHGAAPDVFIQGWEIRRRDPVVAGTSAPPLGLDAWLERFYQPATKSLDEDAAYDLAGYASMKRRVVHGPHVADIAAGPLRWRQTIYTDRDTPPGRDPVLFNRIDAAADRTMTDIAWVQLPRGGLQDSSGGWLDSHILDGLRYVLWCRAANTAKTVVCVSYGSTVGPHNGSSILALALDAIVSAETAATPDALHVVIAAGNSFRADGHALLTLAPNNSGDIVWRVPPGSETPAFLQIWLPDSGWFVTLTSPDGQSMGKMAAGTVVFAPASGVPNAAVIYLASSSRGSGSMVLVALGPTALESGTGRAPALHGDWKLTLQAGTTAGTARAYIARNDLDLNAVLRGRQSTFVDPLDSPAPELREPHDDPGRNADDTLLFGNLRQGATLRRRGTMNAIACGPKPEVVAGHCRNFSDLNTDRTHAPYSSAGPGPNDVGRTPTTSYPTDESEVLRGVRAAGSRSGSVYRLVGTSTAAPQLARWLLSKPLSGSRGPPPPPSPDPALFGDDGGRPAVIPF